MVVAHRISSLFLSPKVPELKYDGRDALPPLAFASTTSIQSTMASTALQIADDRKHVVLDEKSAGVVDDSSASSAHHGL